MRPGGTFMTQWDPAKKDQGRQSLYGSMLLQIKKAGGRIKGLLWYQGEAEANEANLKAYPRVFPAFIAAIRDDLHQPDLPFYLVQIGRFAALNKSAAQVLEWRAGNPAAHPRADTPHGGGVGESPRAP